jgi:hypothetical protein
MIVTMAIRIHRTAEATSRGQKLKKNFTWLRAQNISQNIWGRWQR